MESWALPTWLNRDMLGVYAPYCDEIIVGTSTFVCSEYAIDDLLNWCLP